ncbi:hypothetical protein [Oceanisphaera psychrotolerans]|uniref:Uncharacterized protein n=1 Tax=Oceanisphaera psychrotolerans TaxID=1414654 RepID=A0A1J4QG98_9GAMM|nr:hypothetical protein [Oceanisphaera psychrotolerans]OIN12749.1 hypothetical protein BFR47_11300 [Oceanisphaera psychrotolerans]
MKTLDKWAERIYAETDVGRSIATSAAGVVGLSAYLVSSDWVIAVFSAVIAFPLVRLVATGVHARTVRRAQGRMELEEAERIYGRLSEDEKTVVQAFVQAGGSVLTWGQVNQLDLPGAGIESLVQREVVWTSVTADGMRETFALDSAVFDVGQKRVADESNL